MLVYEQVLDSSHWLRAHVQPFHGEQKHACGTIELCDGSQATSFTVLVLWHRLAAQPSALCNIAAQQLLAGTAQGLRH